uniref:Protein MAIN-LIKE 2-like n=1 Tax=Elaeis guineensis var. tenera TaxID=51953 RepID=A0A6I9SHH9_ELAGV|nr:protein MAIN-LIKE 2-like [Elaeis guineensis]
MAGSDSDVHPGPTDPIALYLQTRHRSDSIYSGEDMGPLCYRHRGSTAMRVWQPYEKIVEYLHVADFYETFRVCDMQLDWALITAMVEQWCQKTHNFYLRIWKVTIILQDVAVLLGLWVHGLAIVGTAQIIWSNLCEELFGITPLEAILSGSSLRFHWLRDTFHHLSDDADDETV